MLKVYSSWLLSEVEQTKESDALTHENFVEMFTDAQLDQIYQNKAGPAGVTGPDMPKAVKVKGDKIERMLNFLEKTSPVWRRPDMLHRVREIFFHIHQVQESGDPLGRVERYRAIRTAMNLEIALAIAHHTRVSQFGLRDGMLRHAAGLIHIN